MKALFTIGAALLLAGCSEVDKSHPGIPYLLAVLAIPAGLWLGGFGGREKP